MGIFDSEDLNSKTAQELQDILDSPLLTDETQKTVREIQRMRDQVEQAGFNPDQAAPRESLFWKALDLLDTPRQAVAGVVDAALRGDIFTGDVGTGAMRGMEKNISTSDILREHELITNPVLNAGVGFLGDMLTDPLSWLSFGGNTAVKAGGKALSEAGQLAHANVLKRLVDEGGDLIQASSKADDIFKAAHQYEGLSKDLIKLLASKDASNNSIELLANQIMKAQDTMGDYLKLNDPLHNLAQDMAITGRGSEDLFNNLSQRFDFNKILDTPLPATGESLFAKPKIALSQDLPFVGHLQNIKQPVETVLDNPGPIGQALRTLGKVIKPGKVTLGELEISDDLVKAFDNMSEWSNKTLMDVGQKLVEAEQIPYAGNLIKAGNVIGKKVKETVGYVNNGIKNIFNQKAIWGADAHNNRLDFINYKAAAKDIALTRSINALGEDLLNNEALQKEIMLAIDAQAMETMKSLGENKDVLKIINSIENTGKPTYAQTEALNGIIKNSGLENEFAQRIANLKANVSPEMAQGIERVTGFLDELHAEEVLNGVDSTFLGAYIPHRYANLQKVGSPFKPRKYDTFTDAFETKGYIPDFFLAGVLAKRAESGMIKQAEKNFFNRLVIENGLPPEQVTKLYREAQINPEGSAAKLLEKRGININALDKKTIIEGNLNKASQVYYSKLGSKNVNPQLAQQALTNAKAKFHDEMWLSGNPPKDLHLPMPDLNELGEVVKYKGSDVFLPRPIARAYNETVASKDLIKSILGESKAAHTFLNSLDAIQGTFKRLVTLPFPAYYGQNLLGNMYRDLLKGSSGNNPAIAARAYSLLSGKSIVTSKNGMKLDKAGINKVIKQFGLNYSVDDYLNHVDSFAKSDVTKYLAQKNGIMGNLKAGNAQAALEGAHRKMIDTFEGFFKINTFLHKFEEGNGIADAVRYTNDLYFNYRDMSPVEASLFRRFYMFYGYMSQATKSAMTDLITNPGRIQQQVHGANALMNLFTDPSTVPTMEEFDSKLLRSTVGAEEMSRVIGMSEEGKPIVARGFASPLNAVMKQFSLQVPRSFSIGEILSTASDSASRTLQKQFAASNPIINSIAQRVSGKNLYFDKPLSSTFLRKLPSLNGMAQAITGMKYDKLPLDLDAPIKAFLNAVPDGTGKYLIGDPNRMWILTNLVPFLGRANSMVNAAVNPDIDLKTKAARLGLGINLDDADISRTRLFTMKQELGKFMNENSIKQILKNQDAEEE